jgi:hypothetical protein
MVENELDVCIHAAISAHFGQSVLIGKGREEAFNSISMNEIYLQGESSNKLI